jgi:glycine/D-amino acid oxidase-like deaminating enzyme
MSIEDLPPPNQEDLDKTESFDVIIVGGGAAGVAAAIGARQAAPKARIIVLESEACLGGAMTHRGVAAYCGLYTIEDKPRQAVGAIWTDLRQRLLEVKGTTENVVRHRGVFQVNKLPASKINLSRVQDW